MKNLLILLVVGLLAGCQQKNEEKWEQLFNGKDLTGWTVKIKGYPVGENFGNTFRVQDGILKVNYDGYNNEFNDRFGHIYTNKAYSNYKLRVEYRFVGDQINGGPGWAYRNSGAMLHAQAPETMAIDQDFPNSVEAQMLGGDGEHERHTGNVCTPGTEIYLNGELYPHHCADSKSKTYHGDQWVTLEMVVENDILVHHIMEGDTILSYGHLMLDNKTPLKEGRIALQSESHPVEFRKVEILDLSKAKK